MKTVNAFSKESHCVVRRAFGARKLDRSEAVHLLIRIYILGFHFLGQYKDARMTWVTRPKKMEKNVFSNGMNDVDRTDPVHKVVLQISCKGPLSSPRHSLHLYV